MFQRVSPQFCAAGGRQTEAAPSGGAWSAPPRPDGRLPAAPAAQVVNEDKSTPTPHHRRSLNGPCAFAEQRLLLRFRRRARLRHRCFVGVVIIGVELQPAGWAHQLQCRF
ncbi:unnamed protein product [Prorocentrum cordatum]|uniref:Uncharacterized protein n=1 Tax=Prorocentrum cordatum TaxID=2364126 RepID=A0ABN9WFY7_9DINO|nr:unnamed protein product [Polarella glacialis]